MESEEEEEELGRPLIRDPVLFDAASDGRPRLSAMPRAEEAARGERDAEDVWAALG